MADETDMQRATKELIDALNEAAEFHPYRMQNHDAETNRRYEEIAARVEKADQEWLRIFRRQ